MDNNVPNLNCTSPGRWKLVVRYYCSYSGAFFFFFFLLCGKITFVCMLLQPRAASLQGRGERGTPGQTVNRRQPDHQASDRKSPSEPRPLLDVAKTIAAEVWDCYKKTVMDSLSYWSGSRI